MLFDLDNAFGYGGEGFGYQSDSIAQAEGEFLFRSLLLNPQFKHAFINRTADLLNTAFSADNVTSVIESLNDELKPDLPEYFSRWNLVDGDMDVWEENIDIGREFAANRPDHLRKLVVDRFQLVGTAELRILADPECGTVRVNSITIAEDTPGVPDPSDWSGTYFKGVPLTIEAIPLNGCQFSFWEGIDAAESSISVTLDSPLTIKAVFAPVQ